MENISSKHEIPHTLVFFTMAYLKISRLKCIFVSLISKNSITNKKETIQSHAN